MMDRRLDNFIIRPLGALDEIQNLYDFDYMLYPRFNRSHLMNDILVSTNDMLSRHIGTLCQEELVYAQSGPSFFKKEEASSLKKSILEYEDKVSLEKLSNLKYDNILIVDAFDQPNILVNEVIKIIRSVNTHCKIYVFSLFLREYCS